MAGAKIYEHFLVVQLRDGDSMDWADSNEIKWRQNQRDLIRD